MDARLGIKTAVAEVYDIERGSTKETHGSCVFILRRSAAAKDGKPFAIHGERDFR